MTESTPFSPLPPPPSPTPIMAIPSSTSTTTTTSTPLPRGRPRSSSISNGSPNPPPTPFIPLPTLFPDSAPSSSSSQHSFRAPVHHEIVLGSTTTTTTTSTSSSIRNNGWGHKPTSSVPNVFMGGGGEPISPGGGGMNKGRHRRSQSSSPDGFPILFDKTSHVGGTTTTTTTTTTDGGGGVVMKEWTYPKPSPIPISSSSNNNNHHNNLERSSPSSSLSTSPHSPSFFSMLNSLSSSPNSHHHFPSSHSALLSGVRSHALPHSPTMEPVNNTGEQYHNRLGEAFEHNTIIHHHPILSNSTVASLQAQASPPFGPSSPSHHTPSPLALEMHRGSPILLHNRDDSLHHSTLSNRRKSLTDESSPALMTYCSPCSEDDIFPNSNSLGGRMSPPLIQSVGLDVPVISTRARAGSFGTTSPPSPALLYLSEGGGGGGGNDQEEVVVEMKSMISISPPPSPPLIERTLTAGVSEGLNVKQGTRQRSRSFTSERDFAPTPMLTGSFTIPPPLPPPSSTLPPPPPPPLPLASLSEPLFPLPSTSTLPLPIMINSILPPPPLPPSSSSSPPPLIGEESDRWSDQVEAEENRMQEVEIGGRYDQSERGEVERELSEAGTTQMDLGGIHHHSSSFLERELSPLGNPEHYEISSYISTFDSITFDSIPSSSSAATPLPISIPISISQTSAFASDEGFSSSPPTVFPPFLSPPDDPLNNLSDSDRSYFSPESEADSSSTEDGDEEELERNDRVRRLERAQSVSPPPVADALEEEEERNTSTFGSLGYMEVDGSVETAMTTEELSDDSDAQSIEGDGTTMDEESLSALERIFICAKSENAEQRARVAHHLPDWLLAVDICEAVEYVLPLLAGLATDSDEIVKEVFSPQIDRIMWHFFSQCPLLELDPDHDPDVIHDSTPAVSPVPSRFMTSYTDGSPHSPSISNHHRNDSGSNFSSILTPTSTQKTSPSNTEVSEAPKISVTNFTSLLGALLTDQSTLVAKATQVSLVRFLCRLKGKPLPLDSATPSPQFNPIDFDDTNPELPIPPPLTLPPNLNRLPYYLTVDARRVLEDEVVTGIVLGLARLDDEERDGDKTPGGGGGGAEGSSKASLRSGSESDSTSSSLVLSPEEEQIEDGWLDHISSLDPMPPSTQVESWGEPMVSFFDDSLDHSKTDSYLSNSPNQPMYSSFSADGNGDEESAIGKMVSMSLIAAIAASGCLEPEVLVESILPEVDRMKAEPMFYVRKEAMTALGTLAKTLPIEVFESAVLPLHASFTLDSVWHVRRAACLSLPAICSRLPPSLLRSQVISSIQTFSSDSSRNVRSGALEVCGELIYLFNGKEEEGGVPEELMNFFLGKNNEEEVEEPSFAPLISALDAANPFYDAPSSWTPAPTISTARDPDRPVMCAFNFPAVALTLGSQKWQTLEPYYASLCQDKADKVRQSLASSMHEITKIIGPAQSDKYLLEPFSWFLRDFAHIQSAVLENISTLILGFGLECGKEALGMLGDVWPNIGNWRRREAVAKDLAGLGAHFVLAGAAENVLSVLAKAFKDPVAAVRDQAVYALPAIFEATENNPLAQSKLWAFLFVFSEDSGYRNRMTYTSCALAAVKKGVNREIFETYFVDALARLSQDSVINVRIGVSRAIAEACRSSSLYSHPESRARIQEILYHLAHSSDRDVKDPVLEYYLSSSPSPPPLSSSPPPSGLDRSGARSRMDMNEDEEETSPTNHFAIARTNSLVARFGIEMDEISLHGADSMEMDIESSHDSDSELDLDFRGGISGEGEGEDVNMRDTISSPVFLTRELEGEEEFVEVSREVPPS